MPADWFRRYVLPGFILKSVIIGGGYATGREFAEFFLSQGPVGGLIGIAVATVIFSVVYALSLQFARVMNAFEYRSFFQALLGRGWIAFEVLYVAMMFLVLSVIGATCGAILNDNAGLPSWVGTLGFMVVAGTLAFHGAAALEKFLVFWSFVLYGFYLVFVILCVSRFGDRSAAQFSAPQDVNILLAALGGIKYAGYNIAGITATLFCAAHLRRPGDAFVGGLLGGPLAMLPGLLFYVGMVAFYPTVLTEVVPMNLLLGELRLPVFKVLFLIVLFSTLIGAGTALLHAFNERIAAARGSVGKTLSRPVRGGIATVIMLLAVVAATEVGLVDLVAKGYGIMTFAFIAVFALPLVTIGSWKIAKTLRDRASVVGEAPRAASGAAE